MSIETGKRQVLVYAVLDFPSVGANDSEALTVVVPQAKIGQAVHVSPANNVAATKAQGLLTLDVIPVDTNTMTVDTKVYTFLDTLLDVDGNVEIGANVAASQANIVAAFDLSGTAGVDYAASMTAHPSVDMADFAADDSVLSAKIPGAAGDAIATTETFGPATDIFDGTTLGTTRAGVDSSGLTADGFVSAADEVTVTLTNATAGALNPDSGTFRVIVWF
jgi:hypothetical protein